MRKIVVVGLHEHLDVLRVLGGEPPLMVPLQEDTDSFYLLFDLGDFFHHPGLLSDKVVAALQLTELLFEASGFTLPETKGKSLSNNSLAGVWLLQGLFRIVPLIHFPAANLIFF